MAIPTGAIRYNTDSNKMECFDGMKWWQISVSSPDLGKATNSPESTGGARGVAGGGTSYSDVIEYLNIESTGDTTDFGDLSIGAYLPTTFSDATRGIITAMESASPVTNNNIIEYITIASTGNSLDFGDVGSGLSAASRGAACSDSHGGIS